MAGGKADEALGAVEGLDLRGVLGSIQDPGVREAMVRLMNLVEALASENRGLREQVRQLQDELNRLKGQSPRPSGGSDKGGSKPRQDYSSEKERQTPKTWSKGSKLDKIHIDREQKVPVDPALLPKDAEFKGYESVMVQDLKIATDNVLFLKEKWYSPSEERTYLAELPAGYAGEFGPGVHTTVPVLYFGLGTSEPKIVEFLEYIGLLISDGQVSNILIKDQDEFHDEAAAVREAGLASGPWQHLDSTITKVNGLTEHSHVLGNPLYSAYDTRPSKDRLTVIDVLRGRPRQDRQFLLNEEALGYLQALSLSAKRQTEVRRLPWQELMDEATLERYLAARVPELGPTQHRWVAEALAIAAYHAETGYPVVRLLVCDDAPQFALVTDELALCWIHDGRHYAKLGALLKEHCDLLADFREQFWKYYHRLRAYQQAPCAVERERLEAEFDRLFTTQTGFLTLDRRIGQTYAKKRQLLAVLGHPEVPLHNNPAELAARRRVRKRDVSFGPRTAEGAKAWDTFHTLAATAQKLEVSFYQYIHDRVSGAYQMPALADLIRQRAPALNLGASWVTA